MPRDAEQALWQAIDAYHVTMQYGGSLTEGLGQARNALREAGFEVVPAGELEEARARIADLTDERDSGVDELLRAEEDRDEALRECLDV